MKKTRLISFFLTLVLSIQVLPLQQIAAWLSSGQVTEEISHTVDPVKSKSLKNGDGAFFTLMNSANLHLSCAMAARCNYCRDEALYSRYADEILIPPPNA